MRMSSMNANNNLDKAVKMTNDIEDAINDEMDVMEEIQSRFEVEWWDEGTDKENDSCNSERDNRPVLHTAKMDFFRFPLSTQCLFSSPRAAAERLFPRFWPLDLIRTSMAFSGKGLKCSVEIRSFG